MKEETQRDIDYYNKQIQNEKANLQQLTENLKKLEDELKQQENINAVPTLAETISFLEKAEFLLGTGMKHYLVFLEEAEAHEKAKW